MTEQITPKNLSKTLTKDNNTTFIFKKGNYTNTYVIAEINGLPDDQILYLGYLDENDNFIQLYTPFDLDGNYIRTKCCCESNNIQAIPLPAKYNSDYSYWEDYPVGTYNWILRLPESENFFAADYPFNVKIIDFETFTVINSPIFPNGNLQASVRTYSNNIPDATNLLTANATYNSSTGIITYPNEDIIDLTAGKHTQVINDLQILDYEVKNPVSIWEINTYQYAEYADNINIYIQNLLGQTYPVCTKVIMNGKEYSSKVSARTGYNISILDYRLPPGVYNFTITSTISEVTNEYSLSGTATIPTTNCTLSLVNPNYDESNSSTNNANINNPATLTVTYLYNNTTPIPNATVQIINSENNSIIYEGITDNNGQISTTITEGGQYQAAAININNEHILLSNTWEIYGIDWQPELTGETGAASIRYSYSEANGEVVGKGFVLNGGFKNKGLWQIDYEFKHDDIRYTGICFIADLTGTTSQGMKVPNIHTWEGTWTADICNYDGGQTVVNDSNYASWRDGAIDWFDVHVKKDAENHVVIWSDKLNKKAENTSDFWKDETRIFSIGGEHNGASAMFGPVRIRNVKAYSI